MKELQELTYILTEYKVSLSAITKEKNQTKNCKLTQLFNAIQKRQVKTDEEAAFLIYGEGKISGKYSSLKVELKKRLLNIVLFIDSKKQVKRDEVYYQCYKEWAACRILLEKSARYTAIRIANKIFKKAVKFDFYELIISISLVLRNHYALREKNKEKFLFFDQQYEYYRLQETYNNLAHKYYMILILEHTKNSVTPNPKIKEDAKKYSQELFPLKSKTNSIKFHYHLFQIQLIGEIGVFDYQSAKGICDKAITYFKGNNIEYDGGIRNLLLNKLVCHIQLKEFHLGTTVVKDCEKYISIGTFQWFKTHEFFFLFWFHAGDYQKAYRIYRDISTHPRFTFFKTIHETWSLYKTYLHFLYQFEEISLDKNDSKFSKIRLGKFLNNVPTFSKDKHGMNIPVLIIQMAFLISLRKYDAATERIDALKKYCDRYLKVNNPNFRCHCFIKMLVQIPISGFHRAGVERRAQRYLKKLDSIKINFYNQAHEVEVLPFEIMWQFIIYSLQNRFSKTKELRYME